jgi:hypothetical protein
MALKDPEMRKQGTAGQRQHVTLAARKLGIIGGLKVVRA